MIISTKSTASTDVETGYKAEYIGDKSNKGNNDTTYDADVVDGKRRDESHASGNDDDSLPQCLICFETFVDGSAITTHCTDKVYHRYCIMEWLMKHDNCPYCRSPFFPALATKSLGAVASDSGASAIVATTRGGVNNFSSMSR